MRIIMMRSFGENRAKLLEEIYLAGVTKIVCAGYDITSSEEAIKIATKNSFVYSTCGISPNDIEGIKEADYKKIITMAKNKKVVAIGEIGLDYYWNKENINAQKEAFIKQIEIANNLDLPIVIHSREAVDDTIDILKNKIKCKKKGVFHCCPLNIELVKNALQLGFYISFAGPITFKSSKNANLVINEVPMDKILIETDAPYLAPEPVRGTTNNSKNLKYIAQKIAEAKQITLSEVAKATYTNAERLFETNLTS